MDDGPDTFNTLIDYIAGRCDPDTESHIRQQLQNPDSPESKTMHQIDAVSRLALSDEMLDKTRQIIDEWLTSIDPQTKDWAGRVKDDKPGRQIGE